MQRAICNKLVQRALRDAQAALQAGNQPALRMAICAAHLCVEENFLHELEEDMRAQHTLDVLREGLPPVDSPREGLPPVDSPRERRLGQAVAMLNSSGVSA